MIKRYLPLFILTLSFANNAKAIDYSGVYFFGDSLTDSGTYIDEPPIAGLFPIEGKFTTNPGAVWSELVGQQFEFDVTPANQGGTNYAAGGARVNAQPGFPNSVFVPFIQNAPSVANQIDSFLSTYEGIADPNALYSVWAGANDASALRSGDAAYNAKPMEQVAQELTNQIARLQNAGARYILVANLPNLGSTPSLISAGATAQAEATLFAQTFNQSLFAGLANQGIAVIPIDTYGLLELQLANPAAFGILNTTDPACGSQPAALVCGEGEYPDGADQTYAFADGTHPTTKIHALLADYVLSVLAAPQQFALLTESTLNQRSNLHDILRIQSRGFSNDTDATDRRAWMVAQGATLNRDNLNNDPGLNDDGYLLALGAHFLLSENWTLGLALSGYEHHADFGFSRGDFTAEEIAFSVTSRWQRKNWSLLGIVTYGENDYSIDRDIPMDATHFDVKGDTHGSSISAEAEAAYHFKLGQLTTGPYLGLLAQKTRIDGFAERGEEVFTLAYGRHERNALRARLGWSGSFDMGELQPYYRIGLDRNLEDEDYRVEITSLSIPDALPYKMQAQGAERTQYIAELGLEGRLTKAVTYNLGTVGRFDQDNTENWQLFGAVDYQF